MQTCLPLDPAFTKRSLGLSILTDRQSSAAEFMTRGSTQFGWRIVGSRGSFQQPGGAPRARCGGCIPVRGVKAKAGQLGSVEGLGGWSAGATGLASRLRRSFHNLNL